MVRGRGGYSSSRGGFRGNSWGGGGRGGYGSSQRFSFSGDRSDKFQRDDYHKSYRQDSYSSRDNYRSPERKRPRSDAPSSRHDSYSSPYGGRYIESHSPMGYSDRRGYSGERHGPTSTPYQQQRRDDFRKPPGLSRGPYRGRLSVRGSRGFKMRDRGARRRLVESSYAVRKRLRGGPRGLKMPRMRSSIIRRRHYEDDDDDDDEKLVSSDEDKPKEAKDNDAEEDEEEGEPKQAETEDKDESKEQDKSAKQEEGADAKPGKVFIKLTCPRCNVNIPTFRRYEMHIQGRTHLISMRKVAMKHKSILAQMRQAQRKAQNELEQKGSSEDLTSRTQFCILCKLNYKQPKAVHQASEGHKNMKKFLMPYCKVCSTTLKSPMMYENHCCSIPHIKRKQRMAEAADASGEEDNLEDFTTIDSVGDVDENASDEDKDNAKKDKKEPVNVGIEKIRKVESHYCDLCRMYLPRSNEDDVQLILSKHCKLRIHMQRYVRYKENQELEKKAEKLQRKETAEKEKKIDEVKKETESPTKSVKEDAKEGSKSTEEDKEDKMWEAVDKDIGDFLGEADGNEDDDDDDAHVNGERYDRFKLSEEKGKKGKEAPSKTETEKVSDSEEAPASEVKTEVETKTK